MIRHTVHLVLFVSVAHAERHAVFSLLSNRPLAHLQSGGGLYLPAGSVGMAKYIHYGRPAGGWKLRVREEQRRVAIASAASTLEVPLTAAQAASNRIQVSLKMAQASSIKISCRGKSSAAAALQPGWQVVSLALPVGALAEGENLLTLWFAHRGAAVEFIQVGGAVASGAAEYSADGLARGQGLAYYSYIPRGGALEVQGEGGGCTLTARLGSGSWSVKLDGTPLDLRAAGERFARLELQADGPSCSRVHLTRADLTVESAPPQRLAAPPPKNVVVWLTDDTRADRYPLYNPKSRVETPVFDELAKTSTLFKVAYTQGNESRVSHASLWTSVYPGVHKMIPEKAKLPSEFVTLAEAVRPSGRYTAGVMANGFIDAFWGFGDGWDSLRNNIHDKPAHGLSADAILSDGLKVIDGLQARSKPFFLYLGTIDAHVSWRAHEPWLSQYDRPNGPYSGLFVKGCSDPDEEKIVLGKLHVSERDKERIRAIYDSDVSYNDAVLGKLVAELRRRKLFDETMLIVTSDHGEEFWDHGKIGHGQSLREELVHVPFLIRYPPLFPARVVDEGIDVMDLLPTLTEALGVATPEAVQGESLIPLAQGLVAGYPRPAIASQYELAHTLRLGRYKLWVGGSGDTRLFDVVADPREDHELSASHPVERRALTDALGTWMAFRNQWKKRRWGVASNLLPSFTAELER